ncbi:MAG: F0F1 ATP synthase subunit alpha [Endomicrobium sp.]|jgi:F-type H+-transporting ATPase subunit alpha|nr:F0F1 ATP synthase subunit alpha [Endomicrobium sp.]
MIKPEEIIQEIENKLNLINKKNHELISFGIVESIGDDIIQVSGLLGVGYYEKVIFDGGSLGLVINIDEYFVSIILLKKIRTIVYGMKVISTGEVLSINVSEVLLGRVIDPLGDPIDGKGLDKTNMLLYPIDRLAPNITKRSSIDTPLKTGIKAIDIMTPIGRGQRELLIGDRGTGKTAIAIDTIINQKLTNKSNINDIICIYCSIGQKQSSLASIFSKLQKFQAMKYTIIVAATASSPVSMQYIAPLAACAIGEYFMDKGGNALIVYDDLIKHAWAYRQISLLIRRPSGREAYPGDVFYLHAKLLERSAKLAKNEGGGSLTALPIVETQENDLSAYIPTNIISITDGQIYLEADLFNAGIRPAINVGLSVSRIGSTAQTKAMKQLSSPIRLELSQFRELQLFTQLGSDLDQNTLSILNKGKRIIEILKQPQYKTYDEISEILSIFSIISGLLDDIDVTMICKVEQELIDFCKQEYTQIIDKLSFAKELDKTLQYELKEAIIYFKKINNYGTKFTTN